MADEEKSIEQVAMNEFLKTWDNEYMYNVSSNVNAKTFFNLGREAFDGGFKLEKNLDVTTLPEDERETYTRFRSIFEMEAVGPNGEKVRGSSIFHELARSGNGGFNSLAVLQYLVDHPDCSYADALNPNIDPVGKRAAGNKILDVFEASKENPQQLGQNLAEYARKLSSMDVSEEYRKILNLPKDVSNEDFIAALENPENRLKILPFSRSLKGISIAAEQALQGCMAVNRCDFWVDRNAVSSCGVSTLKNEPEKTIFEAMYNSMTDADREQYIKWNRVKNSVILSLSLEADTIRTMANGGAIVGDKPVIFGALARRLIATERDVTNLSEATLDAVSSRAYSGERQLSDEEVEAALFNGLKIEKANEILGVNILSKDRLERQYFNAASSADVSALSRHFNEFTNTTGLPTLGRMPTVIDAIDMLMVIDGCDIAKDIVSNSPKANAKKKEYAKKFEKLLSDNTVFKVDAEGKETIDKNAVENLAAVYISGVDLCANYKFPKDYNYGVASTGEVADSLEIMKRIGIDASQIFEGRFAKLKEFKDFIGDNMPDYASSLLDFQALIKPVAEVSDPNVTISDRVTAKIQTDIVKEIMAGKSVAELHEVYPPNYFINMLETIHATLFDIEIAGIASEPDNVAQLQAFIDGGPLPSFMSMKKITECVENAKAMAEVACGRGPVGDNEVKVPQYAEQKKLNPVEEYNCIANLETTDNVSLSDKIAQKVFIEALTNTTQSMTIQKAKAMYPEELVEEMLNATKMGMQALLSEKMSKKGINSTNPQLIADVDRFLQDGPMPSVLDVKSVNAELKKITKNCILNYNNQAETKLNGVMPLSVPSDISDRLAADDLDRMFGLELRSQVSKLNEDLSRQEVGHYFPSLGRSRSRKSLVQLAMIAEGEKGAINAFASTPEAEAMRRNKAKEVVKRLRETPPAVINKDGTITPQKEQMQWAAEIYEKAANYYAGLKIPEAIDYSLPENADLKQQYLELATTAQDHVQIFIEATRTTDDFQNTIKGDANLEYNRVSDYAQLVMAITSWNNPQSIKEERLAGKLFADAIKNEVCGKTLSELDNKFPPMYIYVTKMALTNEMVAEYRDLLSIKENEEAFENFMKGGVLPDFIRQEKLDEIFDKVNKTTMSILKDPKRDMSFVHPERYPLSEEKLKKEQKALDELESIIEGYKGDEKPLGKAVVHIVEDAIGMTMEEAAKHYPPEYVANFFGDIELGIPMEHSDLIANIRYIDGEIYNKELKEFVLGGPIPCFLSDYGDKIRTFLVNCAERTLREYNEENKDKLKEGFKFNFVDYEKCPLPLERTALNNIESQATGKEIYVSEKNKKVLFNLDIKKITPEAITDGRKSFDEMIDLQFSNLKESLTNLAVSKEFKSVTGFFLVDGKKLDDYLKEQVPDYSKYSEPEKEVIRKIGVMHALASGEHIVGVINPGIINEVVGANVERVNMDLAAFNGMEKWYQSSRKKKSIKTLENSERVAAKEEELKNNISNTLGANAKDVMESKREIRQWNNLTPTANKCITSYFPLNIDLFEKMESGKKVDIESIPEEQRGLYKRFTNLMDSHLGNENGKSTMELFRGSCGGFSNLAMMQYLTDNPNASLCDALNPDFEPEKKLEAGNKIMTLLENVDKEPKELGVALAAFDRRLADINVNAELRQVVGVKIEDSEEKFKGKLLGEKRKEAVGFLCGLSAISVGMHQIVGKCFVSSPVPINENRQVEIKENPGKDIYKAFYEARKPEDRERVANWSNTITAIVSPARKEKSARVSPCEQVLHGIPAAERIDEKGSLVKNTDKLLNFIVEHKEMNNVKLEDMVALGVANPLLARRVNAPSVEERQAEPVRRKLNETNTEAAMEVASALAKKSNKQTEDIVVEAPSKEKEISNPQH